MDLTRAEFRNCNFINCKFLKSDLSASDFWECQFVEPTFKDSNLNFIIAQDVRIWKSNKWVEIQESSSFADIWEDM